MISFEAAGMTDKGLLRATNEDALCLDQENGLFVVADGMGGHNAGEVASRMVIHSLMHAVQEAASDAAKGDAGATSGRLPEEGRRLFEWIQRANASIYRTALQNPRLKGMGSTVAIVWIGKDRLVAANVGDSPIFHFHRKDTILLSRLHTVAAEYAHRNTEKGGLSSNRYGGVLTRAIGTSASVVPHVHDTAVSPEDRIVLCTDGLSDLVDPLEIRDVVRSMKPSAACIRLIDLANGRGGIDNISVIVIRIKRVSWLSLMASQKVANHRFSFKAGPPAGGRVVFCEAAETV
ncbi:MAG: protein phosphatase 2C domain-containing protein [Thermodesulfobacteriota bacterium]